jgi:regulatory protein
VSPSGSGSLPPGEGSDPFSEPRAGSSPDSSLAPDPQLDPQPDPTLAKAGELLARRPHFRRELEAKLSSRGFSPESVARACDRLEREGYLDDLECARGLVEGALRRKGYGPLRVRAELARRGATEEVIEAIAGPLFGEAEEELARDVAERWLARHSAADAERVARLARHLERKGFTRGAVRRALHETGRAGPG